MRGPVLFLGRSDSPVLGHLRGVEPRVEALEPEQPLTTEALDALAPDLAVSHGYKLLLREPVLARVPVVNLHISYLPYNRGVHPALWSVLEGTPSGVSIHHVDAGLDTGDLIAQERVELLDDDSFADAYARLQGAMLALFRAYWPAIRAGTAPRRPQPRAGTLHRYADYDAIAHLLPDGWDTRVGPLRGALSATSARSPR